MGWQLDLITEVFSRFNNSMMLWGFTALSHRYQTPPPPSLRQNNSSSSRQRIAPGSCEFYSSHHSPTFPEYSSCHHWWLYIHERQLWWPPEPYFLQHGKLQEDKEAEIRERLTHEGLKAPGNSYALEEPHNKSYPRNFYGWGLTAKLGIFWLLLEALSVPPIMVMNQPASYILLTTFDLYPSCFVCWKQNHWWDTSRNVWL